MDFCLLFAYFSYNSQFFCFIIQRETLLFIIHILIVGARLCFARLADRAEPYPYN